MACSTSFGLSVTVRGSKQSLGEVLLLRSDVVSVETLAHMVLYNNAVILGGCLPVSLLEVTNNVPAILQVASIRMLMLPIRPSHLLFRPPISHRSQAHLTALDTRRL